MSDLVAHTVLDAAKVADVWDLCALTYDERFLRRRVLHTARNAAFLVDLAKTTSVNHGDAFHLTDGRLVGVIAAKEDLLDVRGPDLVRLAWHVGNRHTPCQIEPNRLVIQRDKVIRTMLERLGANVTETFSCLCWDLNPGPLAQQSDR